MNRDNPPRAMRAVLLLALGATVLAQSPAASAQTQAPLTEKAALQEAMAQNPTLSAAMLDAQQAMADVDAEDSRYVPILQLDAGATHNESPSLVPGGTRINESNVYTVGSEIRHTFPWGTSLAFRLEGSRTDNATVLTGVNEVAALGPGYEVLGRFSVVQPLIRGFGNDVGEASLRQAELAQTAANFSEDQVASETLRDVLIAYWELWYTDRAVEIEVAAGEFATKQRDEAQLRVDAGALAPVDLLTFETRLAELSQSLAVAQAQRQNQALTFGQVLGREAPPSFGLKTAADTVPQPTTPTLERVLASARKESFELKRLEAQLAIARDQASIAGDAERPRLDLDAYVQAQGLGNDDVPDALEQFSTFAAVSAHVGLTFELPLSGDRHSAQMRSAALEVQSVQQQMRAAQLGVDRAAAGEVIAADTARRRVEIAERSVEIAEKNVQAQRARYEQGEAIAIEVNEAEESLRRSRLSLERAKVDLVESSIRLDHLMGELLRRYASHLPKLKNSGSRATVRNTASVRPRLYARPLF